MPANLKARTRSKIKEKKDRILVLLATPDDGLRQEWTLALEHVFQVDAVPEWAELERVVNYAKPDVVLLDSDLILKNGRNDFSPLQPLIAASKVIIFSKAPDDRQALLAVKAGARGYSKRNIDSFLLRKAVYVVQKGEIWLGRRTVTYLLSELSFPGEVPQKNCPAPAEFHFRTLTPRENQVSRLIAEEGACNKEISARLNISERTVKAHLTSIFQKLQISDRLGLAVYVNGHR